MGTQANTELQAPASAVRTHHGDHGLRVGAGPTERLGYLATILIRISAAAEMGIGDYNPLECLAGSLLTPAVTPLGEVAVRTGWSLPKSSPFESVALLYNGISVLITAVDRQWNEVPVALVDFGAGVDRGRNVFTYDDGLVTVVLTAMADYTRCSYRVFRAIGEMRCQWSGGFTFPGSSCHFRIHANDWISSIEPTINHFRPWFQGLPNL